MPIENLEKELSLGYLQPLQGSSWLYAAVGGGGGSGGQGEAPDWPEGAQAQKEAAGVESPQDHQKS